MSHRARTAARDRKARQRQRVKAAGGMEMQVHLAKSVVDELTAVAALTGGSVKGEAESLLRLLAVRHRESAEKLAQKAAELTHRAAPYLPYSSFLTAPGATFRVRDRVLTHEAFAPVWLELRKLRAFLEGRGWSRARIDTFLRNSAKKYPVAAAGGAG